MDTTISALADSKAGLFITKCSQASIQNSLFELYKGDCNIWIVDGSNCTSKSGVFREFDSLVHFPAYFGQNWDAFNDCMTDLSWPGMPCREVNGNHVFVVTKAIHLEKLDKRDRKNLFDLFSGIESSGWNLATKRGFYKFILCCMSEQQERVLKLLWEAKVSYEFLVHDPE